MHSWWIPICVLSQSTSKSQTKVNIHQVKILVSHAKKNFSWFVALHDNEGFQVLQIVYTGGFVDYLLFEATHCKRIQNVDYNSFVNTYSSQG